MIGLKGSHGLDLRNCTYLPRYILLFGKEVKVRRVSYGYVFIIQVDIILGQN